MENKRIKLIRNVPVAIGIGVMLSAQIGWADTKTLLNDRELDSINAGATALATAVGLGYGSYLSGALAGTNTSALNVSNGFASVSGAGAGAGAGAAGDGGGAAGTSATTGSGPASVGGTMGSSMGFVGPGGIASGISTSGSTGITYISLL